MSFSKCILIILGSWLFASTCLFSAKEVTPVKTPLTHKRVLWLGDSITQLGGYVTFLEYYLDREFPGDQVDIVSIGLASETVSGLSEKAHPFPRPCVFERLKRALDLVKPNLVVACYGMNDGIYHPESEDRVRAFQNGIYTLISESKTAGAQVLLLTPPPFDKIAVKNLRPKDAPDFSYKTPYEGYDSVLGDYSKWEQTLSESDAQVIDLHTPINDFLERRRHIEPRFSFTGDGIHPNEAGQMLMAEIVLKGLGYSIPFNEDLNKELAKVRTDPIYALVKQQREIRSNGWLAYVGYDRGGRVKSGSVTETEKASSDLQLQIDKLRGAKLP
jgi:lysophospholipase L1-like esterase